MNVFEMIAAQQKGKENTAPWMVGEQLKASNADAARFGVYFHNAQEDINRMMEIVQEIREHDPETADKLCTGVRFILQQTLDRITEKKEG